MVWSSPISLMAGGASVVRVITIDTLIGNLWIFLGSPAGPQSVSITVDGANIGDVQITADWAGGTTFQFVCVNSGSIVGLGGNGGNGGWDIGETGDPGSNGIDGSSAISSDGFAVNVDIDDGYLLGGGGGGGGGSYKNSAAWPNLGGVGDPGSGGGGGQGFSITFGGPEGGNNDLPSPEANPGDDGALGGPGAGGAPAQIGDPNGDASGGGDGGIWGSGGQAGTSALMLEPAPFAITPLWHGGVGGRAGSAFLPTNGASIVYNGAKSEVTLRSESRIKGETDDTIVAFGNVLWQNSTDIAFIGANDTGVIFELNGNLTSGNLSASPPLLLDRWLTKSDTTTAAKYDIRERNNAGDVSVFGTTWATRVNVTPGTWSSMAADKSQFITESTGDVKAGTLMELRRNDVPGNPDADIIASFFIFVRNDNL